MANTLTREQLLALITEHGNPGAAFLALQTLNETGWRDKQAFSQDDVMTLWAAATTSALRDLGTSPIAGLTADEQAHVGQLLGAVTTHAIPLLRAALRDSEA